MKLVAEVTRMSDAIEPFHLHVPEADLVDLRDRLAKTRWPDRETVPSTEQGPPLADMRALHGYWLDHYDWRRCEKELNGLGQYTTLIDGLDIHFLHIRSPVADATPLLMTHGWPGSILEFRSVIGPLTNPEAHGGRREDAFHLVIPSLPGFGFSGKPTQQGWGISRIANAWITLMDRLGYAHWGAQGGDWGALVTHEIGRRAPAGCIGLHVNFMMLDLSESEIANASPDEKKIIQDLDYFLNEKADYLRMQSANPQTVGYFMSDSPIGLAGWTYFVFQEGNDIGDIPNDVYTYDIMLDWLTLYWLTNTGASAARLNFEATRERASSPIKAAKVSVPIGASMFPKECMRTSRRWLESRFERVVHFNELDRSGHFAALEVPTVFAEEIRRTFAKLR
jgi:epoxide hydrolase